MTCESKKVELDDKYRFNVVMNRAKSILGPQAGLSSAFSMALAATEGYETNLDIGRRVHFTVSDFRSETVWRGCMIYSRAEQE